MTIHLIDHASNPFPGRWIDRGPGHLHVRLPAFCSMLWLMIYW